MSFSRCFVACQTVSSTCPSRPAPRQPLRPPTQPVRLATASNTDRPAPRPQEAPLWSRPIPASPTVADADGAVVRTQQARKDNALAAMLAPSQLSACPLPSTSAATALVAPSARPRGRCRKDVRDPTLVACQTVTFTCPSRPARRPPTVTSVPVPSLPPPRLQLDSLHAANTDQMDTHDDTHDDAPENATLATSLLGLHDPRRGSAWGPCGNGERAVGGLGEDARVGGRWSGRGSIMRGSLVVF